MGTMRIYSVYFISIMAMMLGVACEHNGGNKSTGSGVEADVIVTSVTLADSRYCGPTAINDGYNYRIVLSSAEGSSYHFDIYSTEGTVSAQNATLPAGEYILDTDVTMNVGTIAACFSGYRESVVAEKSPFLEARVVVGEDMLEAYVTLEDRQTHYVKREGSLAVAIHTPKSGEAMSSLTANHYFNISDGLFVGAYVGDIMNSGCNTCQVYMWEYLDVETGEERGDIFQIDLQLPRGGTDICGVYGVGTQVGEFIPGSAVDVGGQYMQQNSWYMTATYDQFAPLVDGVVAVEINQMGEYLFYVDMVDDCNNIVRGVFRGVGQFTEW